MTLSPKARKGSKFLGMGKDKEKERERERQRTSAANSNADGFDHIAVEDADASAEFYLDADGESETPVIVEPPRAKMPPAAVPISTPPRPRPRTNSERPVPVPSPGIAASAPEASHLHAHAMKYSSSNNTSISGYTNRSNNSNNTTYTSNSMSTSRMGDLPTRLSGWFSHTFSSSSTDLSLPTLIAHSASPGKGKSKSLFSSSSSSGNAQSTPSPGEGGGGGRGGVSALLTAAKHGKGHLDKAMRYLLDSDAQPDRCSDPIWLLGVMHPGYEPPLPPLPSAHGHGQEHGHGRLSSTLNRRGSRMGKADLRASTSSSSGGSQASLSLSQSSSSSGKRFLGGGSNNAGTSNSNAAASKDPAAHWPPVFYIDFTSRIWLTYRSQFAAPLRDMRLADLPPCGNIVAPSGGRGSVIDSYNYNSPVTTVKRPWNWGGEKTWTSDSGWGCMLRTGQSLLANALIHVHLGRGAYLSL